MSLHFLSPKNIEKENYRKFVSYCLSEARRAIAYACKDAVLRDNESYREWMLSAVDFLVDADDARNRCSTIPWRLHK
jgi:hypothetical protein